MKCQECNADICGWVEMFIHYNKMHPDANAKQYFLRKPDAKYYMQWIERL